MQGIENKGKFITFCGGEGSGKTSVVDNLRSIYPDALFVNDPSSATEEGLKIRELLLSDKCNLSKQTELLLYTAARAELVHKLIRPALNEGKIVICDRFVVSTLVYQGTIRGFSTDQIMYMHKRFCDNLIPDILFLCDVNAEVGLERSRLRLDENNIDESRWENMDLSIHHKINQGFRDICSKFNNNVTLNSNILSIDNMTTKANIIIDDNI